MATPPPRGRLRRLTAGRSGWRLAAAFAAAIPTSVAPWFAPMWGAALLSFDPMAMAGTAVFTLVGALFALPVVLPALLAGHAVLAARGWRGWHHHAAAGLVAGGLAWLVAAAVLGAELDTLVPARHRWLTGPCAALAFWAVLRPDRAQRGA